MILRRSFAATIPLLMVVGIVTACSSVPDVTFTDDGLLPDGGPDSTQDGPRPDQNAGDAPRDTIDPDCKATGPEICDDGVDNDCDGNTDCADSECTPNYQCVDGAPAGFELVAVSDVRTTPCATGYTNQADIEMALGANPACACKCTDNGGTCTGGTVDVTSASNAGCSADVQTRALNRTAAACTAIPGGGLPVGNNNARFEAAVAATAPTSCTPGSTLTLPTTIAGRTCAPPAAPNAGGCPPTQICARRPGTGFSLCATRAATDAGVPASCAGAYTNRRRAGTSISNTTTCDETSCACNNSACGGSLTIYDTANCGAGKLEDITTGATGTACQAMAMAISGAAYTALAYKATATGGCAPTGTATLQGSYTLASETTICCKP